MTERGINRIKRIFDRARARRIAQLALEKSDLIASIRHCEKEAETPDAGVDLELAEKAQAKAIAPAQAVG